MRFSPHQFGPYSPRPSYNGPAISWETDRREVVIEVTGRVIVDANSFVRYAPPYVMRSHIRGFTDKDLEKLAELNTDKDKPQGGHEESTPEETGFTLGGSTCKRLRLGPYHRMLCQSRIAGYSLKTKKWLHFFVRHVKDIKWDEEAFDSLVLDQDHKEMVLAFSESHLQNRNAFDDVISGKGKGMIMLLSGPPGVGKTLTAEAVAEHMHCPLHSITSGDLGSTPGEVERNLTSMLALVARWNAVLLIDECDVFLEARASRDLERNKMVSIFLRTLEYYEGIMFMTTNRADNIDAAFQSRIHVSIEYPELAVGSRRQIWTGLIKTSSVSHKLGDVDFDELAQLPLNGRQIKNILRSAQLLALRRKTPLDKGLVKAVYNIEQRRTGVQTGT
jgi:ATPase family associated with various cellular activities (AAA)